MKKFTKRAVAVIAQARKLPGNWYLTARGTNFCAVRIDVDTGIADEDDPDGPYMDQCCPITAAFFQKSGVWIEAGMALDVAPELGLSRRAAETIMNAADDPTDPLRPELLQLLGVPA